MDRDPEPGVTPDVDPGAHLAGDLPDPLRHRPLTPADAEEVAALVRAAETADVGEPLTELADVVAEWQRPGFDLATDSVGVHSGGRLVAAAEVFRGRRVEAAVHPDRRGLGVGAALVGWSERVADARGSRLVGQTVPAGGDAERLLSALGYTRRWTSWVLALPAGREVPPRDLPGDYALRSFVPGRDDRATWRLVEDAFAEWGDRDPSTFEDWSAATTRRPGFQPGDVRLVTTTGGEHVGACVLHLDGDSGFVHQLAVRGDHRGRGIAQVLLADAFARSRARGAARCELSTDSRTGALGLYERVGMEVTHTWHHLIRDPGVPAATTC